MSYKFAIVDEATGEIQNICVSPTLQGMIDRAERIGPGYTYLTDLPDEIDKSMYYNGQEVVSRPTVLDPSASYDLTQLPENTVVIVRNEAGDELVITDLTEPLTLVDSGTYWLEVEPPFPFQSINTTVEV